jgi:peptidoglycan/LPS O-acetylase OafA/YrhL
MDRGDSEIRVVQVLRAVACLLVVAYHAVIFRPGAVHSWPNGATGVDLFFVISGYVMVVSSRRLAIRPDGWRVFLTRRVRRIVPLYWLLTTIKYALCVAAPSMTPHSRPTAWNFVASLLFIPTHDQFGTVRPVLPVGWTLNYEMLFYGLFAAALAMRVNPLWATPFLAGLAVAGFWQDAAWPAVFSLANGMVLEFAAGMAVASMPWRIPARAASWTLLAGFVLLLAIPPAGHWRFLAWGCPAAAILAASLALESRVGSDVPDWLVAVGDASYAIYLVHPFIVSPLAAYSSGIAAATVPASIVAGLAVHRIIDTKMQRLLKEGSKQFFFEKKNQKTFVRLDTRRVR